MTAIKRIMVLFSAILITLTIMPGQEVLYADGAIEVDFGPPGHSPHARAFEGVHGWGTPYFRIDVGDFDDGWSHTFVPEDPSWDITGPATLGSWRSYAKERGGIGWWQHEDSRGRAWIVQTFNLDHYVPAGQTILNATLKFDYRMRSTDFDDIRNYLFFYVWIQDVDTGVWYKIDGEQLGGTDALAEVGDGGDWIEVWDPSHNGTNPDVVRNDYTRTNVLIGGTSRTLAHLFNTHAPTTRRFRLEFRIWIRLYGKGLLNTEYYRFYVDDARIEITHGANLSPVASFTYSPSSPTTVDGIQFADTSVEPDGTIASWAWNFGDGTTTILRNPTHRYATAGTYTVTLTVTDNVGATASTTQSITVNTGPTGVGGCFIATAAFGTPMAEEVAVLSQFRDQYLLTNELGRRFVSLYYRHSPTIAEYISGREWAKRVVRIALLPVVRIVELMVGE